jgi:hypothetical protein
VNNKKIFTLVCMVDFLMALACDDAVMCSGNQGFN